MIIPLSWNCLLSFAFWVGLPVAGGRANLGRSPDLIARLGYKRTGIFYSLSTFRRICRRSGFVTFIRAKRRFPAALPVKPPSFIRTVESHMAALAHGFNSC
jgi:hypothetical protein